MPPGLGDVHVDRAMTEFSLAYGNDEASFIAEAIFPMIPVAKESDKYFKHDKQNLRAENDGPRGVREPSREASYGLSTGSYTLGIYNLNDLVPDRIRANADQPLDPDRRCVRNITDKLLVGKEIRAAAIAFDTADITQYTTLTGTDQWSDFTNSDPLDDIEVGIQNVRTKTGRMPNHIVMGAAVWSKLKFHPQLIERIKYVSGAGLTVAQVASIVDIPDITVGLAVKNTANENQTDVIANIWGKACLVQYRNTSPAPESGGMGFTIRRRADREVRTWREKNPQGDRFEVEMSYTFELVDDTFGYLIDAAVA